MVSGARIVALAWVLAPSLALAGGTVSLDDIEPLLRQKPALREVVKSAFDLEATVMAAIRFGPRFAHLSGGRMGPYMVAARPKGSPERPPVELVLCTEVRFLDESGRVVQDELTARRVEETLTAVMLREIASLPAIPTCPDR